MRRFAARLLLLLLLLLPILLALNWLGVRAAAVYKDGAALVCEQKREAVRSGAFAAAAGRQTVLFFGTSRILAGIMPRHFDRLSGGRCASLNLALPALPLVGSYLQLRDWLARNPPPQYIVMELYINRCRACTLVDYYLAQGLDGWRDLPPLLRLQPSKAILLNHLYPFRMYKYFAWSYLVDALRRPQEIERRRRQNRAILDDMTGQRGYYYIREQALDAAALAADLGDGAGGPAGRGPDFDAYRDPFTEKFFDLCAERGIRVLLIQPAYRQNQFRPFAAPPRQFTQVLGRWGNVRTAAAGWQLKLFPLSSFADPTHLNPEGARCYTEAVYAEFAATYPPARPAAR